MTTIYDYHNRAAISPSKVKVYAENEATPQRYHAQFIARTVKRDPQTEAQMIGQLVEDLFQRGEFGPQYVRKAHAEYRTAEAKAWRDEQKAAGKSIYDTAQLELIERMVNALRNSPTAAQINAVAEKQAEFHGKLDGVELQCRPDFWLPQGIDGMSDPLIAELKSCDDLNTFDTDVYRFKYHWQAFINRMLAHAQIKRDHAESPVPGFLWIAVDKQLSPAVSIRRYTSTHEAVAYRELIGKNCDGILCRLINRYKTNNWHQPETVDAVSPKWAQKMEEYDHD